MLSLTGKLQPRALLQTNFDEESGQFSPDGHWLAYDSNESGKYEIYATPFPGPGGKRQISVGGGRNPIWRPDGKELFYASFDSRQLMAAEVAVRNGTLELGAVKRLFGGASLDSYGVSADGQKFLVAEDDDTASSHPLTLLQNWIALLKK